MGLFRKYVNMRPGAEVGRHLQFKPQSAVVVMAIITEVTEKYCVITVTWSATGVYHPGLEYEIKHDNPNWYMVRESA